MLLFKYVVQPFFPGLNGSIYLDVLWPGCIVCTPAPMLQLVSDSTSAGLFTAREVPSVYVDLLPCSRAAAPASGWLPGSNIPGFFKEFPA